MTRQEQIAEIVALIQQGCDNLPEDTYWTLVDKVMDEIDPVKGTIVNQYNWRLLYALSELTTDLDRMETIAENPPEWDESVTKSLFLLYSALSKLCQMQAEDWQTIHRNLELTNGIK